MTPEEHAQVQAVFLRIRELPHHDRERELSNVSSEVEREVLSLLSADECCGDFLEPGETSTSRHLDSLDHLTEKSLDRHPMHRRIGAYRILQQIGEGGFGSVFMAEQTEPVHRKVALKLIKPGMDSKQVLARFQAERQALALMNHPSIAQFHDVGSTENGLPYFVMELVRGTSIDVFCEENALSLEERLRLFLQVCDAVHHAHRKGVIHRDLKPSNILVAMGEDQPIAKVIDFGIAKALDSRLTEATLFTEFGQMVGTLEFMSPEQAEMSAVDIDTRSDVYSLGVLLYRLLTGSSPISRERLLSKGLFEVPRIMRDTMPKTPSDFLSSVQLHASRKPKSKMRLVLERGDLDWITMRSLAKNRRERYDSARELAEDVRRFLNGQPVSAHPPTIAYRLSKYAKRHRLAALVSLVVVLSLLLGMIGLAAGWREAHVAQNKSEASLRDAIDARRETEAASARLAEQIYAQLVDSAWRATRQHDSQRAVELLNACVPERRGWEWKYVQSLAERSSHNVLRQPGQSGVTAMSIGPRGKRVGVTLADGTVEIRDTSDGRLVRRINCDGPAISLRLTAGEAYIGTGTGFLARYSLDSGDVENSSNLLAGGVYDIQLSTDENRIAVCTGGGSLQVFDVVTTRLIEQWKLSSRLSSISFMAPDTVVGAGLDGHLYVAVVGNRHVQRSFVSSSSLNAIRQGVDGSVYLLTAGAAFAVDWKQPEASPREITRVDSVATSLASSKENVLVGGGDGTILMTSLDDQSTTQAAVFGASVAAIEWDPAQRRFLCGLADGRIVPLQLGNRGCSVEVAATTGNISDVELLPSESLVITADDAGEIQVCDLHTGKRHVAKQAHDASIWNLAAHGPSQTLVSVGEDNRLCGWLLPSLALKFEAPIDWGVRDVCISPDGTWVAAAPKVSSRIAEGSIGIWDARTGEPLQMLNGHRNWVLQLQCSPDGTFLVSASEDRTARVWNTRTWRTEHVMEPNIRSPAERIAFGPNQRVFLAHRDGCVSDYQLTTGQLQNEWAAFGDAFSGLNVTRDGRVLATSRSSRKLRVWDTKRRQQVANFELSSAYIQWFDTNGNYIATLSRDGGLQIQQLEL